jgi:hypothetical protein
MIHSSSLQPRNAVRHGLSSSLHIPEERIRHVENLRVELLRIHQPQSAEERDCISELALARWKTSEIDRQMDLRIQAEFEQAGMIFDRQKLDQFEIDEKLWHSNPRFRRDLLGLTYHGASLFEQLWSEILAALNSTIHKISLQQAQNMAMMLGSSWNVHELSRDGLWLFSRFLKMEPNTAQTIKLWAMLSNTTLVAGDSLFIDHHFFSDAHNAAICHKDLKERATQEHKFWMLRKRDLEMEYATRRKQFAEMSMGTGLGDPKLANDARLALRYQITAQNRADKLVRRLDGLKRHRGLMEYRSAMAEEREARRLERQSREESAAYTMIGDVQDQDDEMMAHNIESVLEDLTALVGQIKPDSDDTQDDSTQEDAPAVQNKVVDQPVEIESRLQARIDRMMKGRSRSERARIRKQVTAMNKEPELAGAKN